MEQVTETVKIVLDFTGGHFFPFLSISNYFFKTFAEKNWNSPSIKHFLLSQEFFEGEVLDRCFKSVTDPYLESAMELLLGLVNKNSIGPLEDMGLWDPSTLSFCSPLLKQYLFQSCVAQFRYAQVAPKEKILLANDVEWLESVAQVIETGLGSMHSTNFEMPKELQLKMHLVFIGDFKLTRIENLYMSPQTPVDKEMIRERYLTVKLKKENFKLVPRKRGRPPTVDWFLDNRLGVALECLRDGDEREIEDKFRKFREEYKEWPKNAVLNFQMTEKTPNYDSRVFTFVKD